MNTFSERVRSRRKDLGMSQVELARKAGLSQTTISDIERGRNDGSRELMPIAKALKVRPEWLADGTIPMLYGMDEAGHENIQLGITLPHPTDDEFALVPQLDIAASCGDGCFHDHVVVKGGLAFKRSSLRDFSVPEAAARIIYAKGGSMSPTIKDGCVVLLNTAEREPREGKVFAICTPDGDLVLKRLVWEFHPAMGAQTWVMRSDNQDKIAHPDKLLPPDDRTMIVGLAVWNDNRL
jgi:transcriptional regulator with XRE-family HTH domain